MKTQLWTLVGLHAAVRFVVAADPSPGLLPRILEPFARRDLCPDRFEARASNGTMRVEIDMESMPAEMVHLVAGNLGQIIGVVSATYRQEITGRVRRQAA